MKNLPLNVSISYLETEVSLDVLKRLAVGGTITVDRSGKDIVLIKVQDKPYALGKIEQLNGVTGFVLIEYLKEDDLNTVTQRMSFPVEVKNKV